MHSLCPSELFFDNFFHSISVALKNIRKKFWKAAQSIWSGNFSNFYRVAFEPVNKPWMGFTNDSENLTKIWSIRTEVISLTNILFTSAKYKLWNKDPLMVENAKSSFSYKWREQMHLIILLKSLRIRRHFVSA